MGKRPLREAKAEAAPTNSVKQEWLVVNFLNDLHKQTGGFAEHVGGNASYDVYNSKDVAVTAPSPVPSAAGGPPPAKVNVTIEEGNYEVKEIQREEGSNMELARLGSEKAKSVLASPLFRAIISLGGTITNDWKTITQEIRQASTKNPNLDKGSLFEALRYFVTKDETVTKGSLTKCEQMLGLELSKNIFEEVKSGELTRKAEALRRELRKFLAVAPVQGDTVDLYYTVKDPASDAVKKVSLGKVSSAVVSRISAKGSISSSESPGLSKLLKSLEDFFEMTHDIDTLTEIGEVTEKAKEGIKGFFGVSQAPKPTIKYIDSKNLTATSMTQGGRIVLSGVGIEVGSGNPLPTAPPPKPSGSRAVTLKTLNVGSSYPEIEEWYDANASGTKDRSKLFQLAVAAVGGNQPLPKDAKLDTKRGFVTAVYRKLNLESRLVSLPVINETTRETNLLLAELFPQPSPLVKLGLSESYITTVLGLPPPILIEGRIDEAYARMVIREHLLFEAWWDSAKEYIGHGIKWVKDKGDSVADVVTSFGKNSKGVIAGLWAASSDPDSLADLLEKFKNGCKKLVEKLTGPVGLILEALKDRVKKLSDKIKERFQESIKELAKLNEFFSSSLDSVSGLTGWKGLLSTAAVFLGFKWLSDNLKKPYEKVLKAVKSPALAVKDGLQDDLIKVMEEEVYAFARRKLLEVGKAFAASAIESLAGPVAWLKKAVEIFQEANWVISSLAEPMGLIKKEFEEKESAGGESESSGDSGESEAGEESKAGVSEGRSKKKRAHTHRGKPLSETRLLLRELGV